MSPISEQMFFFYNHLRKDYKQTAKFLHHYHLTISLLLLGYRLFLISDATKIEFSFKKSEYISPCDGRREFISGFDGSRGTAVVTDKHAALWTDGRYFQQAKTQMDDNWTLMKERVEGTPTIEEWLNEILTPESRVGVDPFLLDYGTWKTLSKTLQLNNNLLVPVEVNLIDMIWKNKPKQSSSPVDYLPSEYTGKSFQEKVLSVRKLMSQKKVETLIITALDEVAWLCNLRGSDIDFNPVFYSYAVITLDAVYLFVDAKRLTDSANKSFLDSKDLNLKIVPYEEIIPILANILKSTQSKVWASRKSSYKIVSMIPKESRLLKITPVEVLKSIKNETEIAGSQNAHIKDAAALCELFHWLSDEVSKGTVTELSAAKKLENIKKEQKDYVGLSFETISASGPNAAVIHYKPTEETNRTLSTSEMYLCDCGTQYRDGTTDVTRTWHFGDPSPIEKKCYTLVLKGHIALSNAIFPNNCTGHRIDSFARKCLWESGLDYMHGTGHGVGSYLNVHEGPSGISYIYNYDDPGIQAGMILSIEPGYYEEGNFGIRLENLAVTREAETAHNFQDRKFLKFEPLTLVPYQTKLIDRSLLTAEEITWLNNYHSLCQEKVGKLLREQNKLEVLQWLNKASAPLN